MKEAVLYILLSIVFVLYLFFSIRCTMSFKKSKLFSGSIKRFHLEMIWIIPFAWGWLLNGLNKTAPGSHEIDKKEDPKSFSDSYMDGVP